MKKKISLVLLAFSFFYTLFSQSHTTVDLTNDVYSLLLMCEQKNYCENLSITKPYTESYVLKLLNQSKDAILEKMQKNDSFILKTELESVEFYISKFQHKKGVNLPELKYRYEEENNPITFEVTNYDEFFISSGIYNDSSLNSTGFEFYNTLNFFGDLGSSFSYRVSGFLGATKMPLQKVGDDYLIGYWWYDDWSDTYKDFVIIKS